MQSLTTGGSLYAVLPRHGALTLIESPKGRIIYIETMHAAAGMGGMYCGDFDAIRDGREIIRIAKGDPYKTTYESPLTAKLIL